jgi:LacI family transcriptional regulator
VDGFLQTMDQHVTLHVTIKDVARQAGVGIATVSRVLNNSRRVDETTRERVQAAIAQLSYRPNATGRRLVTKSTEMVCFLLSNRQFMNPFHSGVLNGVERFLSQSGHEVVFTNLHYKRSTPPGKLVLPRILTHRGIADGFILSGTNYPNLVAAMDQLGVPYVMFGSNLIGGGRTRRPDAVYYDDGPPAQLLVERLIALGHRHIWYFGDTRMPWFHRRWENYRHVMKTHGLPCHQYTEPNAGGDLMDYGVAYGNQAMDYVLASGEPATAIVAGNDGVAYGAWRALRRVGLRVPEDYSLVGFDDVQEARLTDPQLTTVRVPTDEIGQACARALLEKLRTPGEPHPPIVIPARLIERESMAEAKVLAWERARGAGFQPAQRRLKTCATPRLKRVNKEKL